MNFQYLKEIFFLIGKNKKKLPVMGALFLILSLLDLAGIGLIAPYVTLIANPDQFLQSSLYEVYQNLGLSLEIPDLIFSLGLVLIFVFIIKAGTAILINYVLLKFCHGQSVALRASLMRAYQGLPYVEYVEKNSSQYIHNINLADKFATGTLLAMLRIVCDGIVVIAIVLFLGFTDIIALILLVTLLVTLGVFYDTFFKSRVGGYGVVANTSSIQVVKSIQESMIGLKEVRVLKKEDYFFTSMYESADQFAAASVKTSMVNLSPRFILEVVMVCFVVLLVLSSLLTGKNMSGLLPLLSMFGIASIKLAPAATSIISGLSKMRFYRDAVSLVYRDVASTREMVEPETPEISRKDLKFKSMSLHNVEFEYPRTKQPAIKDLSVKINKSDIVGFIGTSGAGKTTLIDVILGLLKPQKGELFYNDMLLDEKTVGDWRSLVAYLPQDVFLVDDTLERNIALGVFDNDIDKIKVLESIEKARLTDMVNNLPLGIKTLVGERGVRVSGGQKQRISLARAFYHGREVLVMDESTSALDTGTEQEIVEEIQRLKGEKTMIVIAHRLTTLQHCNAIYRLDGGRLSKKLTYNELIDE
jgi:ATP-binding cassette, subfamily B, bacterial PglK